MLFSLENDYEPKLFYEKYVSKLYYMQLVLVNGLTAVHYSYKTSGYYRNQKLSLKKNKQLLNLFIHQSANTGSYSLVQPILNDSSNVCFPFLPIGDYSTV